MGFSSETVALQFGVVITTPWAKASGCGNPNDQLLRRPFSEGNFRSRRGKIKRHCTHNLQSDLCMTPNFLPQVWARKLFPFKLFYSGFIILLLRSWRCRRVQYVVRIAVCINYISLDVFFFQFYFIWFDFFKGLAGLTETTLRFLRDTISLSDISNCVKNQRNPNSCSALSNCWVLY